MSDPRHLKVSIGFAGGLVLSLRASAEAVDALGSVLATGTRVWHEVAAEDGVVRLDTGQVAYLRVDSDEPRVGFGA